MSLMITDPASCDNSRTSSTTSTSAGSISPKRPLSRTHNLTPSRYNTSTSRFYRLSRTLSTSAHTHANSSGVMTRSSLHIAPHHQRLAALRQRRLRSKLERLNQTRNFYSRRHPYEATVSSVVAVDQISFSTATSASTAAAACRRRNNSTVYRPSFKVEKLLNDSRGMKKYLIDYDCLLLLDQQHSCHNKRVGQMSHQPSSFESSQMNNDLLDNDMIDGRLPYSNRCSSGYLSDC